MMKDVHELFEKHKIPYFVDSGSLLGVIRHKGLIPWDDDLDIGILPENKKMVENVIGELKSLGYGLQLTGEIAKVFIPNKWIQSPVKYSANPTLDIFIYKKKGKFIQLEHDNLFKMWPLAKYTCDELFPLTLYDFGPFKVYGAKNGKGYCDRLYPGWDKNGIIELRCSPFIDMGISKERKISLPMKMLNIFIPDYKVTSKDIEDVIIDNTTIDPSCVN